MSVSSACFVSLTLIYHKLLRRWGLYHQVVCFSWSSTPQLAWIAAFSASVEQCGSTGWHSLCCSWALLNRGSWVAQSHILLLHFCTCFQDNWHFKGRLWILTVCPWLALCLHLKTVWLNLWLLHFFHWSSLKSQCHFRASTDAVEE